MTNSTGQVGVPPIQTNPLGYAGSPINFVPVTSANRDPTGSDVNYNTSCEWTNTITQDLWKLYGFVNGLANWKKLATGSVPGGTVVSLSDTANTVVSPDVAGNIQLVGGAGVDITSTPASNLLTVSLTGGGVAVDQIAVQAVTAPGVTPVTPTAAGQVTVNAAAVTAHSVPIETRSRALNEYNVEAQYSSANAGTDATKAGLCSFNSAQFATDANGWTTLVGGLTPAASDFIVDAHTAPGTNPVIPDGTGSLTIKGTTVAAHGIPIQTDSLAANTINIETQYASAIAATDGTKVGFSAYNSSQFTVDGSGYVSLQPASTSFSNLGITYSASTLTITAADGSALSASNAATVTIRSSISPGTLKTYTITSGQSFIDASGASTISGNSFGLSANVWNEDMPFFIYAITNATETAVNFAICRLPHKKSSPAVGNLGKSGTANANVQYSLFLLDNPVLADYASRPMLQVGYFRMRMTAVGPNDWTVQSLVNYDGMNTSYLSAAWLMPLGCNGASAGTYFFPNGGTAPVFASTNFLQYTFQASYEVEIYLSCSDAAGVGTAGAGAVNSLISLPFTATGVRGMGIIYAQTGTYSLGVIPFENSGQIYFDMKKCTDGVSSQNADWTAAGKSFQGNFRYVPSSV